MNPVKNSPSLSLLRRWLTGEANRHDERLLDGAAASDPFLAEALEGYRAMPEGDHAADVTRLKAGLRLRTHRHRGTGYYLLRAAAAVAVLVVAWVAMQQFVFEEKSVAAVADAALSEAAAPEAAPAMMDSTSADIAQQTSPETAAETSADLAQQENKTLRNRTSPDNAPPATTATPTVADADDSNSNAFSQNRPTPEPTEAAPAAEEEKPQAQADAARTAATDIAVSEKPAAPKPPAPAPAKEELAKAKKNSKDNSPRLRQVSGQVTDGNGNPLIGASVAASGTNTSTITDVDGSYAIDLPSGAISLEFSYTGYSSLTVSLGSSSRLDVALLENDLSLSEVVVVGYSGESDDEEPEKIQSPRPEGGFRQFKRYVADNQRHPEANQQPRPRQVVRVRFTLLADGSLADFNPRGDAPQAYKDEAVRLLREGPRWAGTAGTTAAYRFVFE